MSEQLKETLASHLLSGELKELIFTCCKQDNGILLKIDFSKMCVHSVAKGQARSW